MTGEEIRKTESGESQIGNETAYWLREIAAQLAELNERKAVTCSTCDTQITSDAYCAECFSSNADGG